ncbi:MAG: hypothetical protein NXI20_08285 [bacterium]|nr:hypothetical protein [bacterium]
MIKLFIALVLIMPYYRLFAQHSYTLSRAALILDSKVETHPLTDENKIDVKSKFFTPLSKVGDKDLSSDYRPFVNSLCRIKWQSSWNKKLNLSVELVRDLKYGAGIGMIYRIGKKKCCIH